MGKFARVLTMCGLWVPALGGCSGGEDANQVPVERSPAADGERENEGRSVDPQSPLSALPRFVNGGLRCGVLPNDTAANGTTATAKSNSVRVQVLGASRSPEPACSAPGPWCAVFGPSRTDRENFRLRQQMDAERRRHDERAARLRERVRQAEESALAERRSRLDQLEELGQASPGVYLTNDESMSLASPQRLIWAIEHGAPLTSDMVRPHELLNYFSFETLPVNPGEVFSVLPELSPHPMRPSDLTLGFSVRGRAVSKQSRRNVNLTYVIDRSGSMAGGGRIEMVKRGIDRSLDELKTGDIVSLLLFDTTTCPLAQNFVVGRDNLEDLRSLVDHIAPRGGSNLRDGLGQGYALANRSYQPGYSNRVLLITDVDSAGSSSDDNLARMSARQFDARRVRLSAVGVGDSVSDAMLDRLTEAGKGASMFVSSASELEAIFGLRFTSLVETIATNVHFKLELPASISLRAFYGEESSREKQRVQALHFFSGTRQMYLANLKKSRSLDKTDNIRLSIEFDDPQSGEPRVSQFSWRADELEMATGEKSKFANRNLNKARMVATFGYQLRYMAETYDDLLRPDAAPTWSLPADETKQTRQRRRLDALQHCRRVKGKLDQFAAQLGGPVEAKRIASLWHTYCRRYEGSAPPLQLAAPHAPTPQTDLPTSKLVRVDPERVNDYAPGLDDI